MRPFSTPKPLGFVAHFATGKLEIVTVWDNELCLARLAQW